MYRLSLASLALVSLSLVGCPSNASRCVTGMSIDCVCSAGVHGVQVCQADGTFSACECGTIDGGGNDAGTTTDGGGNDTGTVADAGVDAAAMPDANDVDAWVDPCAGHVYYAGRVDGVGPTWSSAPGAGGLTGLAAGDAACAALGVGADHVCDYEELVLADLADETAFAAIPAGTTAWLQRTTTVDVLGTPSPPGAGGRCVEWNYATNHTADGEYVTFDTAGTPTYHFDTDTFYDGIDTTHTVTGDLQCGGVTRAILCCNAACN